MSTDPIPRHRTHGVMRRHAAPALVAGVALAALLLLLAPASITVPVAAPVTSLAPLVLSGVHGAEENYGHLMRWTSGHARARWAGQFGVAPASVVVTLAGFPGRSPEQFDLHVNGRRTRHTVPEQYGDVRVDLPAATSTPLDIEIVTSTTRPPGDGRALGVRLEAITIVNGPMLTRVARLAGAEALAIVAAGGLAWSAGAWVAGAAASRRRRLLAAAGVWTSIACAFALGGLTVLADAWAWGPPVVLGAVAAHLCMRAGHHRLVCGTLAIVVAAQAFVILRWVSAAFVDVPSYDVWEMVPLLVAQEQRGFAWGDLVAPHNEHRPVVARAVILANIALSDWNQWNELWLMLGLLAGHVLVYVAAIGRMAPARPLATVVAVAGVGTFVASATQWENLLHPWQITAMAGAAAVSVALVVLCTTQPRWGSWLGAVTSMLVGTGAFASCLVAWPLGAIALAVRGGPRWIWRAGAWLLTAVLVGAAYLHGLERPAGLPPPAPILTSTDALLQVLQGTFIALAMPVWYEPLAVGPGTSPAWDHVPAIGVAAASIGALLLVLHGRRAARRRAAWLWPALLMLFAIGACAVTAIGRVPLGMAAMTASRYIALTSLFWVGLLLLLTVSSPLQSSRARAASVALAVVIVAAGLRGWWDSRVYLERHHISNSLARDALLRGDILGATALFPSPPVLDARRQVLERRGLSLYRSGAR